VQTKDRNETIKEEREREREKDRGNEKENRMRAKDEIGNIVKSLNSIKTSESIATRGKSIGREGIEKFEKNHSFPSMR